MNSPDNEWYPPVPNKRGKYTILHLSNVEEGFELLDTSSTVVGETVYLVGVPNYTTRAECPEAAYNQLTNNFVPDEVHVSLGKTTSAPGMIGIQVDNCFVPLTL